MRSHGSRLRAVAMMIALVIGFLATPILAAPRQSDEAVVRDFYRLLVDKRDVRAAFAQHVAADYIEHSVDVPGGGRAATIVYMERLLAASPDGRVDVLRAAADRGLVFLHARFVPAPASPAVAIVEIFRVRQGKIVEHWDVIGKLPETPINPTSPF